MSSRRTSSVPKEDVVFPRMFYCDSRCSQTLTGLSPALPGALLCNATCRLGDGKRVILRQRVRGSVRAVRAVRNTRVFQTETGVVADEDTWNRYLMLGFVSAHIPWNAISNLELRRSYKALCDDLVLPSATTLSNICQREYALTVDAIKKQLLCSL